MLAVRKRNGASGRAWRVAEVNVTLAPESRLTLSSLDGEDDIFSLVEVLLQQDFKGE